jgi:hypothetical protein
MPETGHNAPPIPEQPDPERPAPYAPLAPSPELAALAEQLATLHAMGRDLLAAARAARERGEMGQWEEAMREHRVISDEVDAAMREVLRLVRPQK